MLFLNYLLHLAKHQFQDVLWKHLGRPGRPVKELRVSGVVEVSFHCCSGKVGVVP